MYTYKLLCAHRSSTATHSTLYEYKLHTALINSSKKT